MGLIDNSNLRVYQSKGREQSRIFMSHIIMIEEIVKIGIDQTVEIGELNLLDKVEVDQSMNKIIGAEILEAMQDDIKILEGRIVEENIEVIIGMKTITEKEVGVGLEKDHFQEIIIIEGTIEA